MREWDCQSTARWQSTQELKLSDMVWSSLHAGLNGIRANSLHYSRVVLRSQPATVRGHQNICGDFCLVPLFLVSSAMLFLARGSQDF